MNKIKSIPAILLFSFSATIFANPQIDSLVSQANQGNAESALKLGMAYDYGVKGMVEQNKEEALKFYTLAYKNGSKKATSLLGVYYYKNGNSKEALKYLKEGVDKKEYLSFAYMGKIFEDSDLKPQAAYYYRIAAENGIPEAQYDYGRFYENGEGGISKDLVIANAWYQMASKNNFEKAKEKTAILENLLTPDEKLLSQKVILKYTKN